MLSVLVSSESAFAVNVAAVKLAVEKSLAKLDCPSNAEISVSFVSKERMGKLARKYLKDNKVHEIISFPFLEKNPKANFPIPDNIVRLGEIVISYPQAVLLAKRQKKSVDEELNFLLDHGCKHLMGRHHQ